MRSRTFVLVAALLAVLVAGAGAVYAYDRSRANTIAKGVTVAGVDIGGLSAAAAKDRLARDYLPDIRRPVVVAWHGRTFKLTARQARLAANLDATVDAAVARSREGSIFSRTARNLRGARLDVDIQPQISYSDAAVKRLVRRVGRTVDRTPVQAHLAFTGDGPHVVHGRIGRELQRARLQRAVQAALISSHDRRVPATATLRRPTTTVAQLAGRYPALITINRSAFRLRLYKHLKLAHTYTIAVGQVGLETPAGLYHIQNKAVNPSWTVPNSPWAGSMAGQVIPPGPNDPIKARWMGIYSGAGIHGTDELGSLGTAASHGCIRMAIPDVIQLYPQVRVGTPVYIA